MLGKNYLRFVGLTLVLALVMSLGLVAVKAQDQGVTMIIGWEQEPDQPWPAGSSTFSSLLTGFYARDVWEWDKDRNIYPIMVEQIPSVDNGLVTTTDVKWDDDNDPKTPDVAGKAPVVTYKLNAGMKWSDGQPITADDCMFYHNLMMQPNPVDSVGRGFYPEVVAKAEKVDDLTVVLTYNKPWPDYLNTANLSCAIPAHVFNTDKFKMDTDGDGVFDNNFDQSPYGLGFQDPSNLVGYGPYVFSEYKPGESATFTKNPNWGANKWEKAPAIDTLITQFITESQQMENAMKVGDIDLAFNFDGVNNTYGDMPNVTKFVTDSVYEDGLWFNIGPKAFPAMQDVNVRTALVQAIDRRAIATQFAGEGADKLLTTNWYPTPFISPNIKFREYDVDAARKGLTDAGWVDDDNDESADNAAPTPRVSKGAKLPDGTAVTDGTPFIIRFYTTPRVPRPDIQTIVQADWAKVGVRAQTFVVAGPTVLFASFNDRGVMNTGEYDVAIYALSNLPLSPNGSPEDFHCSGIPGPDNTNGSNSHFFCNPDYDKIDNQVAGEMDAAKRMDEVHKATELFDAANFWNGILPRPTWYAVRSDRFDSASIEPTIGTLAADWFYQVENWKPAS